MIWDKIIKEYPLSFELLTKNVNKYTKQFDKTMWIYDANVPSQRSHLPIFFEKNDISVKINSETCFEDEQSLFKAFAELEEAIKKYNSEKPE